MISTNIPLSLLGTYGNAKLGYGAGIPAGKFLLRDTLEDSVHNAGSPTYNNVHPHLIANKNRNIFIRGSWDVTWEWAPGDFSETQIDEFLSYTPAHPNMTLVKDFTNNKVVASITQTDIPLPTWSDLRLDWVLASGTAKIETTSNNCELLCVTVLNGEYDNYTIESIAVEPGTSVNIPKTGTDHCYMVFSRELTKNGAALSPWKAYKLTSDSVNLANTGVDRAKVIRISK